MNNLILAAIGIVPLLGLLLMGKGLRDLWRGFSSVHWPQTSGVVLASEISESTSRNARDRTSTTFYSSKVTVGYRVEGQEYQTNTLHFGQSAGSSDPSEAEIALLRYPPGAAVTVAYNPRNPGLAAVKPGFTAEVLTLPAIGLALTLVGIMFMVAYQSTTTAQVGVSSMVIRLFSSVFILIGVIFLTPGLRSLLRARASLDWPKAPGVVLYSKTTSSTSVTRDSDGGKIRSTSYNSPLVYEYEVDGRKHYSNTRLFGQLAGSDENWAREIAERYAVGAKIQVSYSPSDPDLAVAEPGISSEAYWAPGAGAAFLLFGLAVLLFMRF